MKNDRLAGYSAQDIFKNLRFEDKMKKMSMEILGRDSSFQQIAMLFVLLAGAPAISYAAQQGVFASPDQAGGALVEANRTDNKMDELLKILGPEAEDLIHSGDPVADKNARKKFVTAYDTKHTWESGGSNKEILVVGNDEWPLPIPLVRKDDKWRFDTHAGRQEILTRRIGHNELNVIKVCRAFVEAQEDYAEEYPGQHEYAQKFTSAPGKHDGLYWQAGAGEKESPLGHLMARAEAAGYKGIADKGKHTPYHGYYYRILETQAPSASGGARNYVIKGRMTGGFALLAFPAKYGDSGIRTFIVNQTGIVYEKDLGPRTPSIAGRIIRYAPDGTWQTP